MKKKECSVGKMGSRILGAALALAMCLGMAPGALASGGSAYDMGRQKLVALTFDDGPGPYSDMIMDTLEARGAKATFFMNGYLIKRYPEAVKRMARDGFELGNHTWDHPFLAKCSAEKERSEIDSTAALITKLTGVKGGFYLRPPYGSYNKAVIAAAGVPVIWCTVDSGDWKYDDSARLTSYTSSVVKDGDIVIMHESHRSTALGLGRLVDKLQAMGYELVTVQELFQRRGITPQAGKAYYSAPNKGVNRCASALYCDESKLSQHWAYDAISYVREKGYMTDNKYGEFTPNFPLTRGMFVTALGRLKGVDAGAAVSSGFSDVKDGTELAACTAWARDSGIVTGVGGGSFAPDRTITRQELACMLARCEKADGTAPAPDYSDYAQIADWAKSAVAYCASSGLLVGSSGAFQPRGTVTRAMGAEMIMRLAKLSPAPEVSPVPSPAASAPVSETPQPVPSV
jgi:peptidoglycan/xylan/chitin deacetylase (PgdA/CDA1 family)